MDGRTAAGVVALVRELVQEDLVEILPDEEREVFEAQGRPLLAALEAHGPALAAWYADATVARAVAGSDVALLLDD